MATTFHILEDSSRSTASVVVVGSNANGMDKKRTKGVLQDCNNVERDAKRLKKSCDVQDTHRPVAVVEKKIPVQERNKLEPKLDKLREDLLQVLEKELNLVQKDVEDVQKQQKKEEVADEAVCEDLYRQDIFNYLKEQELTCKKPKPNYMRRQTNLSWETRSILVDWLAMVADEYNLSEETYHLCVNYIDRFLSRICIVRHKFQLLGASALLVAGKVEEIHPIESRELSYLTGDAFDVRQILKMEQLLLKVLEYRVQTPTINAFLDHLCAQFSVDAKTKHLAMFLGELVLLEGGDYLEHLPSKVAASSLALARHNLVPATEPIWTEKMEQASGYSLKQLSPVVQRQHKSFVESPLKRQQAVQSKYKKAEYSKVALLKPKALNLTEFEDDEDEDEDEDEQN